MEQPPGGHPLPRTHTPGGWVWSPDDGDYVAAKPPAAHALAALPPANTEPQEVIPDGPV